MKIDVEGHEFAALHGAHRFFTELRPILVFEFIQVATDRPERTIALKKFVSRAEYQLYMLRDAVLPPHLADDP